MKATAQAPKRSMKKVKAIKTKKIRFHNDVDQWEIDKEVSNLKEGDIFHTHYIVNIRPEFYQVSKLSKKTIEFTAIGHNAKPYKNKVRTSQDIDKDGDVFTPNPMKQAEDTPVHGWKITKRLSSVTVWRFNNPKLPVEFDVFFSLGRGCSLSKNIPGCGVTFDYLD